MVQFCASVDEKFFLASHSFIHPDISWKVLIKNEVPSSFDLTPTQRSDVNIRSMTSVYHCGIFNGDRLSPGSNERSLRRRVLLNCSLGKS